MQETVKNTMSALGKKMRSKRGKFESVGWYYMMKYFMFLLRVPSNYKPKTVAKNYHTTLAIVPGSRKALQIGVEAEDGNGDITVKGLVYFVPGLGRVTCGISAIANGDNVQVGLMCDKSQFTEGRAEKFIKIFEELYTETVASLD